MKKAYTVILEIETIEEIRRDTAINLSALIRRLLKKHLEENQK